MSHEEGEYRFACPECEETLEVNGPMREALLDRGCVICGSAVSPRAFSRTSSADSS